MLERLIEDVEALGGKVVHECTGSLPTIEIFDLDDSEIYEVSRSLSEAVGVRVQFAQRPGAKLAAALPCLTDLYDHLPTASVGRQELSVFDLGTGTWSSSEEFDRPGAYRLGSRVHRYGFAKSEDVGNRQVRVADHRTVKHLSAVTSARSLCAYDPDVGALIVPLGAELPGLYERAVVLSTGKPPVLSTGTVVYQDVDSEVATQICWKLSGTET